MLVDILYVICINRVVLRTFIPTRINELFLSLFM